MGHQASWVCGPFSSDGCAPVSGTSRRKQCWGFYKFVVHHREIVWPNSLNSVSWAFQANMMNSSSLSRSPPPPCSPLHSRHSRVASLPQIMHCRGEFSMTSVTSSSCDGRMRSYTLNCFPNRGICENFGVQFQFEGWLHGFQTVFIPAVLVRRAPVSAWCRMWGRTVQRAAAPSASWPLRPLWQRVDRGATTDPTTAQGKGLLAASVSIMSWETPLALFISRVTFISVNFDSSSWTGMINRWIWCMSIKIPRAAFWDMAPLTPFFKANFNFFQESY